MKRSLICIAVSSVVGAVLVCLALPATGRGQSYEIRPTCYPYGPCKINPLSFGYNDTSWRQWPLQPRPEEHDAKTIGATPLPTPAPAVEQAPPAAEGLPRQAVAFRRSPRRIGPVLPSPTTNPAPTAPPKTPAGPNPQDCTCRFPKGWMSVRGNPRRGRRARTAAFTPWPHPTNCNRPMAARRSR